MGLALLQSLHELVSSDGDRGERHCLLFCSRYCVIGLSLGHLSWNDYDFFAKLLAIGLSCGLFPEQVLLLLIAYV